MRIILYFFLFLIFVGSSPCQAIAPPPAEIVDANTTSKCVRTFPSYLANQPLGWGTGSKGTALAISNVCNDDIVVERITSEDAVGKQLDDSRDVAIGRSEFVYSPNGGNCIWNIFRTKCKSFIIPAAKTLVIGMPWGTTYKITGYLTSSVYGFWSKETPISVEAKLINPNDPKQAIEIYLKKAEKGDAEAQRKLGYLYSVPGDSQSYPEATKWLIKAAESGDHFAQNQLGDMYYRGGNGIQRNGKDAITWYIKSLKFYGPPKGGASASRPIYCRLGEIYATGMDVKTNYVEAAKWWGMSAHQLTSLTQRAMKKNVEAQVHLADLYYQNPCYHVLKEEWTTSIKRLYSIAATRGNAYAQYQLGRIFYDGMEPSSRKQALEWFTKAAEQGYSDAQAQLGDIYKSKYTGLRNWEKAEKWYRKAAENDNQWGQANLGHLIISSTHPIDEEAYFWLSQATRRNENYSAERESAARYLVRRQIKDVNQRIQKNDMSLDENIERLLSVDEKHIWESAKSGDALAQYEFGRLLHKRASENYKEAYFWQLLGNEGKSGPSLIDFLQHRLSQDEMADVKKRVSDHNAALSKKKKK